MTSGSTPMLSVVIPMFNEAEVLPLLVNRLRPVLDSLDASLRSGGRRRRQHRHHGGPTPRSAPELAQLRVIRLRRNSGHQAALTAGLNLAFGQYVVSLDADLQDPPEKITEMLGLARAKDLDIVYGVRLDRSSDTVGQTWLRRPLLLAHGRLAGVKVRPNAGDFRLLSRATVDALRQLPERQPVYRLLVPWLGFPSGEVGYVRREACRRPYQVPAAQDAGAGNRQRDELHRRAAADSNLAGVDQFLLLPLHVPVRRGRVCPRRHRARLGFRDRDRALPRRGAAAVPRACSASTWAGSTRRCRAGRRTSSVTTRLDDTVATGTTAS